MSQSAFRKMRVVGVEDGNLQKGVTQNAILAAVLAKGAYIEDAKTTKITADSLDATEKLAQILRC